MRGGTDADGPGLARLIAAVFSEYDGCPFVPAEFPELGRPATHYAGCGGALFVLEAGGDIVGSAAVSMLPDGTTAELHKLYLAPTLRGTGQGRRLYQAVLAHARASGARAVRLFTDTRFLSGHAFYERQGFRRLPVVRYLADATRAWEYAYRLTLDPQ